MGPISDKMMEEVRHRLSRIEEEHGVRILYACESGSRSWGFPSPRSDYDVRFIYMAPARDYLRLTPPPETIELPQDGVWDIAGWDLRKTLHLLQKGNPSLIQWLYSPILYRSHSLFLTEMRRLLDHGSPLPRLYWAYRSMAQAHITNYLIGREEVVYKRFLYIVQALLAMRWVEEKHSIPPVIFEELVTGLVTDEALLTELSTLLRFKTSIGESESGPKILFPGVLAFIEETLAETQPPVSEAPEVPEALLDDFFIKWLGISI